MLWGETLEDAEVICMNLKPKPAHVNTSAQVNSLNQVEAQKSKKATVQSGNLELDTNEDSDEE